jgi:Family of unknown function (DUF6325)
MPVGSIEYAVIAFPGNHFKGEIIPAIQDLVDNGIVRILDIVIVVRDADGDVESLEVSALPPDQAAPFAGLDHKVHGLLNEDDIIAIASALEPESSAAILVWENLWSSRFAQAVMNADGVLVANVKVPADVVKAAMDYAESIGVA